MARKPQPALRCGPTPLASPLRRSCHYLHIKFNSNITTRETLQQDLEHVLNSVLQAASRAGMQHAGCNLTSRAIQVQLRPHTRRHQLYQIVRALPVHHEVRLRVRQLLLVHITAFAPP